MVEHKRWPVELDSYDLEEVYAKLPGAREAGKVIRITIHGQNIIIRALEPVVRIGDVLVQYPEIGLDERSIAGFLPKMPRDGAPIHLEYEGRTVAEVKEPFSQRKLKRL